MSMLLLLSHSRPTTAPSWAELNCALVSLYDPRWMPDWRLKRSIRPLAVPMTAKFPHALIAAAWKRIGAGKFEKRADVRFLRSFSKVSGIGFLRSF